MCAGLVAARYLKLFGCDPTVLYPVEGKADLFTVSPNTWGANHLIPEIDEDFGSF